MGIGETRIMFKWLINKYWAWRYPEWTRGQVEEYFRIFGGNIWQFRDNLIAKGFVWASDGLNVSRYTDTFARPEQVLARKFGNCGDFMRLFEEFIKFTGCAVKYIQHELTCDNSLRYHYVMQFTLADGQEIIQSNLEFFSPEVLGVIANGYDNVKIIDKWERGL